MRAGATSRTANIHGVVKSLRIRELQVVLGDLNLSRSGRKQELVDRIVNSLEQFELKANENASNHATSAYYNDQLTAGLRSLDTQYRLTHHGQSMASAVAIAAVAPSLQNGGGYATPPPSMPRNPPPPPPGAYGRPLPYPGHLHNPHSAPQQPHHHHHLHHHRPPSHYQAPPPPSQLAASHGNEVLIATTPPALDGARCLCGNSTTSSHPNTSTNGKIVTCVGCALRVHAKCHQLVACASTDEWYCELCRASLCDPFLKVTRTLRAPVFVKFTRNQVPFRIEYTLSDADIAELYAKRDPKPGAMTAGCLELQLRCFAMKEELGTGTSWPTTSVVVTNGFNMVLVQRAAPGQSNPSKVLREQPVSLFPCSRVGRNVVEVRTSENPLVFAFMVQIVEFQSVESLMNQVQHASADISYEQATREVVKSFGGGDDDEDDDEDAIVTTSTILSVRCPLGLCVIDLPARGVHCKHLQCFDLRTFLLFNRKARSRHYRCTICHNFIKTADLRIDPYLKKLLTDVQGDDELEEVELYPDATWKRRVNDDAASSPPPAKRLKQETGDTTTTATATPTSTTTTAAAAGASSSAAAGSASAPFEIDLSLSSDDDDDDDATTVTTDNGMLPFPSFGTSSGAPKTSASSTTSGTASTSTLSDDDVAIFTVDSDVWETSGVGGSGGGGSMMAFPLDLFSSFPSAATGSENGSWNASSSTAASSSSYAASSSSAPAATSTAAVASASSSAAWASTSRVTTSSSDAELASAMAQLSRNHPHVNNPFDRQPAAAGAAPRTGGGASGGGASGGGGGGGGSGMLDVICLLDSDSDSD